tara:strand:+ start:217 stop:669 length:453 start_codon:yes stop_codon:yes gene_type:complete
MGTRSAIGYKTATGIRAVYCHYDGYVSNNGKILQEHYQAAYKICRLIEQGDMSTLQAEPMFTIGSGHSFETPEQGVVVYYGRDRGETGCETREFANVDEFETEMSGMCCEYLYLFNGQEWIVSKGTGDFKRVQDLLEPEEVEEERSFYTC